MINHAHAYNNKWKGEGSKAWRERTEVGVKGESRKSSTASQIHETWISVHKNKGKTYLGMKN